MPPEVSYILSAVLVITLAVSLIIPRKKGPWGSLESFLIRFAVIGVEVILTFILCWHPCVLSWYQESDSNGFKLSVVFQ